MIRDRSPIHRRANLREYREAVGREGLRVEELPAYAPDLNPVEWLWRHLKEVAMANFTCLDVEELDEEFHQALGRIRGKPRLFPSFFAGAGLNL